MGKTTLSKFKWFWAWNDDKEEAWLRSMAQQGWHLRALSGPALYAFDAGEPRDVIYRLDYRTATKMDRGEYLQLFRDAGWEHVLEWAGWQYFRKLADAGGSSEIYSDAESKIDKYRRLVGFLGILISLMVIVTVTQEPPSSLGWQIIKIIQVALLTLLVYGMIRILLRIRQLKRP